MKLIAKAKPVKIRIKSGDEEHISLESLRKNFEWEDVRKLFDGGLYRWLRRIDKSDIAEMLKELGEPENDILATYNILFRGESHFSSEKDVFEELPNDPYLLPIATVLISELSAKEALKYTESFSSEKEPIFNLLKKHIIELATSFNEDFEDGELLYEVGKFLNNHSYDSTHGNIEEVALNCFKLAKDKEFLEAIDYINAIEKQKSIENKTKSTNKRKSSSNTSSLFDNINHDHFWRYIQRDGIKNQIDKSWQTYKPIEVKGMSGMAKIYFDFSNTCLTIQAKRAKLLTTDLFYIANKGFGSLDLKDPLYQDKMFVLSLLENRDNAKLRLKEIQDYPIAKAILDSDNDYFAFKGHIFQLGTEHIPTNAYGLNFTLQI